MMLPRTRIMTRLARVNVKLMLSRPLRPLAKRLFSAGGGEIALPVAQAADSARTVELA
jgi:hypothetical protein